MYGYVLKPSDFTPLYYCYEVIYDNPKLAIDDIKKYYKKCDSFEYDNIDNINDIYNQLNSTHNIRNGDIIVTENDEYYFFSPNMIKIILS